MIRRAEIKDVCDLMTLCERHFYAVKMDKRLHTFDYCSSMNTLISFINNNDIIVYINDDDGILNGIIVYAISNSAFNILKRHAVEILWYSESKKVMIKLHNKMMDFVKKIVDVVYIGVPIHNNVGNWLTSKGFILTEKVFGMEAKYV